MPTTNRLTLSSGFIGTAAAALLTGENAPDTGRVDLIFSNSISATETVVLTFQVNGGTAVEIWRADLNQNEKLKITGLPINGGDTLLASTNDASAVSYLIMRSAVKTVTFEVFSANGTSKATAVLRQLLQGIEALSDIETVDPG